MGLDNDGGSRHNGSGGGGSDSGHGGGCFDGFHDVEVLLVLLPAMAGNTGFVLGLLNKSKDS
jgi:hypothetical protein